MPAFHYQALDAAGRTQRGLLQGDTARAARAALRERGLAPVQVREVSEGRRGWLWVRQRLGRARRALLLRELATLLSAGLPIDEALSALAEPGADPRMRAVALALRARVMEGAGLAAAMAEHPGSFPELYRASVAAGERSGHLGLVLDRLADDAEAGDALRQQLLAALAYPLLLGIVALLVVGGLLIYVVPQIVDVFARMQQDLPWTTRALMGASHVLSHYGIGLLVLLLLAVMAARAALLRPALRLRWHAWLLRWPLIGRFMRVTNTAHATRTLALLTGSAVPLLEALTLTARVVPNLAVREALEHSAQRVREGSGLARALGETRMFLPVALRLIAAGERSGTLERMLGEAAAYCSRRQERVLTLLTAVLGPALILLVGGLVLFIVLAILLPVFNLNQLVK